MNRVDQPTADDVILDLLIDGVEPTHENLVVAIAAYPQHRDALVAFFANLAVQTALKDEPAPSGCSVEQFANIGVSRVLVRRHEAQGQTSTDIDDTSGEIEIKSMPPRLSQLIRALESCPPDATRANTASAIAAAIRAHAKGEG